MASSARRIHSTRTLDGEEDSVVAGSFVSAYIVSRRNVEALVVLFTYGRKPDEKYTALAREVMHQTGIALQPGRWAVNFYPARKSCCYCNESTHSHPFLVMYVPTWFPGAGFQRWARDAKETFYRLTREPFHRVKSEMVGIRSYELYSVR